MAQLNNIQVLRLLASILRTGLPGRAAGIALFVGAGAPRAAGLPLADELKMKVAERVFGSDMPHEIAEGRLEDVMELFQSHAGKDGYALVAQEILTYQQIPHSYDLLADFVRDHRVDSILTTNFDVLFERMADKHGLAVIPVASDQEFLTTEVPHGSVLIGHLHGSALHPETMRGSWTDVKAMLPVQKRDVLFDIIRSLPMVFIGYAARDPDQIPILRDAAQRNPERRIFWVNPCDYPSEEIKEVHQAYRSEGNYIAMEAETFFQILYEEVYPLNSGKPLGSEQVKRAALRLQGLPARAQEAAHRADIESRSSFRTRVEERTREFLDAFRREYAPGDPFWHIGGSRVTHEDVAEYMGCRAAIDRMLARGDNHLGLVIHAGGPATFIFFSVDQRYDQPVIKVDIISTLFRGSKASGRALPPIDVWECASTEVKMCSEASFREYEGWLNSEILSLCNRTVVRLSQTSIG